MSYTPVGLARSCILPYMHMKLDLNLTIYRYDSDIMRKKSTSSFTTTPPISYYIFNHMEEFTNEHYEVMVGAHNVMTGVTKLDVSMIGDLMWNEYFYRFWYRDRENRFKALHKLKDVCLVVVDWG